MAAVNRHNKGVWFSNTVSKDDLEEGDGEFTTNFDNPMEGDSASIILELLKKAVFIDADKNCEGSGWLWRLESTQLF